MSVYGREKVSVPITAKLLSTISVSAKTEREREKKRKTRRLHAVLLMLSNKTYEVASDLRTQTNQLLSAGRSPIGDLLRVGALAISFGLSSVTFTFTTLN